MATIQLRNLTGRALQRSVMTGTGYLLDAPDVIAKDETAQWQVTGSGTVTYGIITSDSGRMATQTFTLTWDASTPGLMRYDTTDVSRDWAIEYQEIHDGCIFTAQAAGKQRPPLPGNRVFGKVPMMTIVTLITLVVLAAALLPLAHALQVNGRGSNGPNRQMSTTTPPTLVPTVQIPNTVSLTANPTQPMAGVAVLLSANATTTIDGVTNVLDIIDTTNHKLVISCKAATCTASVTSPTPTTLTYQAQVEKGFLVGVPTLVSTPVAVTWTPLLPKLVTLAADRTTLVINNAVSLTAIMDVTLANTGEYVRIEDASGNKVMDCNDATTCKGQANSATPTTITFQAVILKRDGTGGVLLTSNMVSVTWTLPPPPMSVTLAVSATTAYVNQVVHLHAHVPSSLTNTGYEIVIIDTTSGNILGASCSAGNDCYGDAAEPMVTSQNFRAILQSATNAGAPQYFSSLLTVQWILPPPTSISLSADNYSPTVGTTVTLTSQSDLPVDGTHYYTVIVETVTGGTSPKCISGTICTWQANLGYYFTGHFIARVLSAITGNVVRTSNEVDITWLNPPPTSISLVGYNGGPDNPGDWSLTATTNAPLDNTGYYVAIYNYDTNLPLKTCALGTTCNYDLGYTGTSYHFRAYVFRQSDNFIALSSNIPYVPCGSPTCT